MSLSKFRLDTLRFLALAALSASSLFSTSNAWATDGPLFQLSADVLLKSNGSAVSVEVDETRLQANTDRLTFTLDGIIYVAEAVNVKREGAGLVWVGTTRVSADGPDFAGQKLRDARPTPGLAAFHSDADHLYGVIHTGAKSYRLWPSSTGGYTLSLEESTGGAPECDLERSLGSGSRLDLPLHPPLLSGPGFAAQKAAPVKQRLLVAAGQNYTQDKGGVTGLVAWVKLLVAVANQIYLNGAINLELELAHVYPGDQNWNTDIFGSLKDPFDGYFDEVPALREQHAADLVILLLDRDKTTRPCGYADEILGGEATAYAYVAGGGLCSTAETFTFTHEAGHLQGASHDETNAGASAVSSFGYGYFVDGGDHPFRTVMSYGEDRPEIPYFSNPYQIYFGQPIGTLEAFNAYQLWLTRQEVAAYRLGDGSSPFLLPLPGSAGALWGGSEAERHYGVQVPASKLSRKLVVEISGGAWSGNAELYVRGETKPTNTVFDCARTSSGPNQLCEIQNPPAGTYRIMVRGGGGGYAGVTLDVSLITIFVIGG